MVPAHGPPRPLALAGAACLLAAVAGAFAPPAALLAGAAPALVASGWLVGRAGGPGFVVLLAGAAGLTGAARARAVEDSLRRAPFRARPPPALAQADDILVARCGEDPIRNRAWLVGRAADGPGVLCSWPGALPDALGPGARVRATGRASAPAAPTNPGERDRLGGLARDGIAVRLYLGEKDNLAVVAPGGRAAGRLVRRMRRTGARRLADALPPRDAGLASALLFGWRSGITDADRLRFERTGTLHLLAISGLHLLLVAGAVHALARRLGLGPRGAAAVTLLACLGYVPVAGAGAPVRRAAAVLTIYGVALARGRVPDAASALGGAALLIVLQDAEEVRRIGFWLSFTAAAGIALHAARWHERWSARHRLLARFPAVQEDRKWRLRLHGHLLAALPVSLAAWCATAPIVAWRFGLVTPWAPVTNLVAAPFVTVLMPLFAAMACGASFLAPVAAALCAWLRRALDFFDAFPGACLAVPPPAAGGIALWYVGYLALRARPRAGVVILGAAAAVSWLPRAHPPPSLTVLDVGHGQAVLLRDGRGRAALVDGGSRNRPDLAGRVLRPALRALGVARLDLAVCTHADRDHWNGLAGLVGRVPIRELAVGPDTPEPLVRASARYGTRARAARTGDVLWNAEGIRVRVVDDGRGDPRAPANDRSLVLLVELGSVRVLLPADRETHGTRALLRRPLPRCDVLLAPHHGGRNEAAAALGDAVRPRWLLVSTGPRFADEATLRRYGAAAVLSTERHGALSVTAPGGRASVAGHAARPADTIRPP